MSNGLMTPKSDCILHLVDFLRVHQYQHWCESPLGADQCAYIWADGIYSGLRSEKDKLCALVIIGVNERGQKRFLAIEDGVRESTQSWREVLLKLKSRGMNVPQLGNT